MLDQGRAAFDPIAVVGVGDAVHVAQFGGVDVPADDAVEPAPARLCHDRLFVTRYVLDRVLDLVLEEGRQRPVRQTEPVARDVEPAEIGRAHG